MWNGACKKKPTKRGDEMSVEDELKKFFEQCGVQEKARVVALVGEYARVWQIDSEAAKRVMQKQADLLSILLKAARSGEFLKIIEMGMKPAVCELLAAYHEETERLNSGN